MSEIDRPVVDALDRLWAGFRKRDRRIPRQVVWSLQPTRASWCNSVEWTDSPLILVVNLVESGELVKGEALASWAAHLAAHSADPRPPDAEGRSGEWTTSFATEGMYHPEGFREAGDVLGLQFPGHERGRGWFPGELEHSAWYRADIESLDEALSRWAPEAPVVRQKSRGPLSIRCRCDELPTTLPADRERPRVLRASVGVVQPEGENAGTGIRCEYCGALFERRESPTRRRASRG